MKLSEARFQTIYKLLKCNCYPGDGKDDRWQLDSNLEEDGFLIMIELPAKRCPVCGYDYWYTVKP